MSCKSKCEEFERRWCCMCWVSKTPPLWIVICAAIAVQVGFGLYPVVVEQFAFAGHEKANAYIFSFYRDAAAFPILIICTLVAERKLMIPNWKMMLLFAVLGLTGMFGGQLFYISGVYFLGADVASAYQPILPVWVAVIAMVTCTERVPNAVHLHTWTRFLGILLSVGGAIELALTGKDVFPASGGTPANGSNTTDPDGSSVGETFVGYIMVFFNTFLTALYVVLQKKFIFKRPDCKWRDHPVAVTTYSYMFGALFMGLASLYFVITGQTSEFYIPLDSIYALVYAIFVTSCLCYLLLTWSNLHLSPSIVSAFWPVQVLVAGVGSFLLAGELFAPLQYIGTVALLAGLLLVLFSSYMDERLNAGMRAIRLDSCFLKCCPGRRRANLRLVNIDDFFSVNSEDEDSSPDVEAPSKLNQGRETDRLLHNGQGDTSKHYGINGSHRELSQSEEDASKDYESHRERNQSVMDASKDCGINGERGQTASDDS